MKAGFFVDTYNHYTSLSEKYDSIGWNTGNILFFEAIKKTIDCDIIQSLEDWKMEDYDAFITTEFIWIQESTKPSDRLLNRIKIAKNRPIIPISVGLQSDGFNPDFTLQPEMLFALKELESRCTLAVRGEYTAETLRRHGVTNIEVIGCPSMYQIPLYADNLDFLAKEPSAEFTTANYRSFYGELKPADHQMLQYIATHCHGFSEQTLLPLTPASMPDSQVRQWFDRHTHLFFDLESWVRHNSRYDFSFGLRFHGNVAAILAGVRSLFITFDSRTREMTDYFSLPSIGAEEFSLESPLLEHAQRTDYSSFINVYKDRLNIFTGFLEKNSLGLTKEYGDRLSEFRG
ncbi:polysaccharide pyruvyl transferase family protein [Rhizobium giardinii]|uniref:Polysaccharide pyruvyl transferase domain-containing protein n=1 Tax=Rhizobium giardinii TaxID=56731 RepID=A0A7W8X975_9HYPH|nr:polysaccharide pyruvyl transferase family protein [Rhizobium giardinii]MBB5536929.1 hypothetical protein [Rhizobium giardinii]